MVVLHYGNAHELIHSLANKYVFACVFGFCLFQLQVFLRTRTYGLGGNQPVRLRTTRLNGSCDQYVKSLTKILMVKRFNHAWGRAIDRLEDDGTK